MYKINNQQIVRDDGAWIPADEGNRDYLAYLQWVNQGNKAEDVVIEKPLAMGTDLIKFINLTTETSLNDDQAFMIVSKLKDFMIYCQQGRCNPFTRSTFNNTLKTLDKAFANGQKELIVGLVNKWAETVRFEEK
jgi:hypothetical protein